MAFSKMYVLRRLPQVYCLLIACAVLLFVYQAWHAPPSTGTTLVGWTPLGWQPGTASILCWSILLAGLAFTPKFPCVGLAIYLLVEHSSRRYGPELEYVFRHGLPEWTAALTALGAGVWWIRHPHERVRPNPYIAWSMISLATWASISTGAAVLREGSFSFEVRHHPVRYLDALLLFGVAAVSLRKPRDYLVIVIGLTAATTWRVVQAPETIYLDGDLGEVAAIGLPLLIGALGMLNRWATRWPILLSIGHHGWLLLSIQSRGALVGGVAGTVALWLQSRRRIWILLVSLPLLAATALFAVQSGLWSRIRESVPGGKTFDSVKERLELWRLAWEITRDHPILGVGPGNYAELRRASTGGSAKSAHSNYLSILAELGFVGLLLYLSLLAVAFYFVARTGQFPGNPWQSQAARSLLAALVAYVGAGAFIARHDQALPYLLMGAAAAITGSTRQEVPKPSEATQGL